MAFERELDEESRDRLASLLEGLMTIQADLSLPQFLALLVIAAEPGLSVNDLADRLSIAQQTASRYAAALLGRYQGALGPPNGDEIGRGKSDPLIVQEISQADPRRRALFLSRHGHTLIQKVLGTIGISTRRKSNR